MPHKPASQTYVMSVLGPVSAENLGVTDAHNHLWIDSVDGAALGSPVLNNYVAILTELKDYRQVGGGGIIDCQPGGCGRNAAMLAQLARDSGVVVIAATGFHRRCYYSPGYWLWDADEAKVAEYLTGELKRGTRETLMMPSPVRAGFIKIACEASLDATPRAALEGAVQAVALSGVALEIHTEKGADAENILDFFLQRGVQARQLVICHIDKRPDFSLQHDLARTGVILEYDTFFRPKYEPETRLWPLIEKMIAAGMQDHIALATDMAEAAMWSSLGGTPGLIALPVIIRNRLEQMGLDDRCIQQLCGGNIAATFSTF